MAFEAAGEFQLQQYRLHQRWYEARLADEFVRSHRHRPEQRLHRTPVGVARVLGGAAAKGRTRRAHGSGIDRADRLEDARRGPTWRKA